MLHTAKMIFFALHHFSAAAAAVLVCASLWSAKGSCYVSPPTPYALHLPPLLPSLPCYRRLLQLAHFMQNFENEEGGCFREMGGRWTKWMEKHQHLPYSMARLACSSFYEGKWAGSEEAFEHTVGQEFARALLLALWPDVYESAEWRGWEEEHAFLAILKDDLSGASTTNEKDELTFGMFSKLNASAELRGELEMYAASAHTKKKVASDFDAENPTPRVSSFAMIWTFPLLYKWACHAIFFAPIHQQLVESVFSTYDTCTKKHDSREINIVRLGQFRSRRSRRVECKQPRN